MGTCRFSGGRVLTLEELRKARDALAENSAETSLAFAGVGQAGDTEDFGFPLLGLQDGPDNPLPQRHRTHAALAELDRAMRAGGGGAPDIPAPYTNLGQFVDHGITREPQSVGLPDLAPAGGPRSGKRYATPAPQLWSWTVSTAQPQTKQDYLGALSWLGKG